MLTQSLHCKLGDFGISRLFNMQSTPTALLLMPKAGTVASGSTQSSPATSFDGDLSPQTGHSKGLIAPANALEQTSNCGTARYMAPEVRLAVTGDGDNSDETKASYSASVDVFSVGMVFYYVLEGTPPRLPGGTNPDAHFAALAGGVRPRYHTTKPEHRKVIDLCLRQNPSERPFASELAAILKADRYSREPALPVESENQSALAKMCGFQSAAARERAGAIKERAAEALKAILLRQATAM